jgi:hypothetical protein
VSGHPDLLVEGLEIPGVVQFENHVTLIPDYPCHLGHRPLLPQEVLQNPATDHRRKGVVLEWQVL